MTNSNRLPVFRTLKETTHDQFKKRYKLLLLWACFQWGALILQSLTELIPAIKQNQYVEAEAIILALIVLTWVLFIVLIRKSFQSYIFRLHFNHWHVSSQCLQSLENGCASFNRGHSSRDNREFQAFCRDFL